MEKKMARPKNDAQIDLDVAHALTTGLIARLSCPSGKQQAFLRDTDTKGLRVRVTKNDAKSFVFEKKLNRQTVRCTIGDVGNWSIEAARIEARRLSVMLDAKIDPREVERDRQAAVGEKKSAALAKLQADKVAAITVHEVWLKYVEIRRPFWGDLHYQDHINKIQAGGAIRKKRGGSGLTVAQPLASLMPLALKDLDQSTIEAWAAKEGQTRPTSARLAWRLLTVFLNWCSEQPEYAALLPAKNPAKTKKAREALGKAGTKKDVLQKGQLKAWFDAVRQIGNPTISASLQVLLLTGARLNEVLTMRWDDVNTQWKGININDKVEGAREIPLTSYVERLLSSLPRRNQYVFASARALAMDDKNIARRGRKSSAKGTAPPAGAILQTSETGYISEPNTPHTRACRAAGVEGLTLHGLRRSFKSLTEWLEVPVGVVAQIQGHKPSATAEKHYTVRPLELLAVHHNRIEAWMLEQAGIVFDTKTPHAALRVIAANPS
jgi:integrase